MACLSFPWAPRSNSIVSGRFSLSARASTAGGRSTRASVSKPSNCPVVLRRVWGFFQMAVLT